MITTWGFGGHGGLVSVMGWGGSGAASTVAKLAIPCRPKITDSLDLRPEISDSSGLGPEIVDSSGLVPEIIGSDGDCN